MEELSTRYVNSKTGDIIEVKYVLANYAESEVYNNNINIMYRQINTVIANIDKVINSVSTIGEITVKLYDKFIYGHIAIETNINTITSINILLDGLNINILTPNEETDNIEFVLSLTNARDNLLVIPGVMSSNNNKNIDIINETYEKWRIENIDETSCYDNQYDDTKSDSVENTNTGITEVNKNIHNVFYTYKDKNKYDVELMFKTKVNITATDDIYSDVEISDIDLTCVNDKIDKIIKQLIKKLPNDDTNISIGKLVMLILNYVDIIDCDYVSEIINFKLTLSNNLVICIGVDKVTINLVNNEFEDLVITEVDMINRYIIYNHDDADELVKHVNDMYVKWYSDNISKTINSDIVAKKEAPKQEQASKYNTMLDIGDPYDMSINIITDEEHSQELIKDIYDSISDINDIVNQHIMLESLVFLNVVTLLLSQTSNFNNVTYVVNTSTIELTCECDNLDEDSIKLTFLNKKDDTTVIKVLPVKEDGFLNPAHVYNAFSAVDF